MSDLQQAASDPDYSVWVSASAGTGKTKILTDRFLRLLIKGIEFKNILCLTFTNTGAFEMQTRISNKLKEFAICNENKLEKELLVMTGKPPSPSEIENARSLYKKLLNTESALNIFTIHAFCQKILKNFPLEAGVTPEFQILDQSKIQDVFLNIRNEIYVGDEYQSMMNTLLNRFHEATLQDIFNEIITQKIKFRKLGSFHNEVELPKRQAYNRLNNIYDNVKNLLQKYKLETNPKEIFFTRDGNKRKNFLSSELKKCYPDLLSELENISPQVYQLNELSKIEEVTYYSDLLTRLAYIFLKKYNLYKEENNLLDYDDLIYHTEILLKNNTIHEWLLHKLEGDINHILIDEAQDTSPEQWNIIATLITEFNASSKPDNSIFIVGDDKQSIFSFQGANLANFNLVNDNLKANLTATNKKFKNITLEYSYRSCQQILQFTHKVLKQIKVTNPQLFLSDNPQILSFRSANYGHQGSVTVWPLVNADPEEKLFWPLPDDHFRSLSSADLLTQKIVNFIKNKIVNKEILPSTGKAALEKDFMILTRKRDKFSNNLIKQLKQSGLKVEASDKVILKENLSVMDLIAIAKFVLLPADNLNLAGLLKSPIIGMSEEQLFRLTSSQNGKSLWETLFDNMLLYKNAFKKLCDLIEIFENSSLQNFFPLVINNFNLREILNNYNGTESDEMINELLLIASNYATTINNSLQGFIAWFENNDIEIKRDIEHSDKIRVMTAHGSKGLESPIVIIYDTISMPVNSNKFIWTDQGEMFFIPQANNTPEFLQALKSAEKLTTLQEYIRLFYVAMTRAKDHLIICGYNNKTKTSTEELPKNCWYSFVQ